MSRRLVRKGAPSSMTKPTINAEKPLVAKKPSMFLGKGDLSDMSDDTASDDQDEEFQRFINANAPRKQAPSAVVKAAKAPAVKTFPSVNTSTPTTAKLVTSVVKPTTSAPSSSLKKPELSEAEGEKAKSKQNFAEKNATKEAVLVPTSSKLRKSASFEENLISKKTPSKVNPVASLSTPAPALRSALKKPAKRMVQSSSEEETSSRPGKSIFDDDDDDNNTLVSEEEEEELNSDFEPISKPKMTVKSAKAAKTISTKKSTSLAVKKRSAKSAFDSDSDSDAVVTKTQQYNAEEEEEEELNSDFEPISKPQKVQKKVKAQKVLKTKVVKKPEEGSDIMINLSSHGGSIDLSTAAEAAAARKIAKAKALADAMNVKPQMDRTKKLPPRSLPVALLLSESIVAKQNNKEVVTNDEKPELYATIEDAIRTTVILSSPVRTPSNLSKTWLDSSEVSNLASSVLGSSSPLTAPISATLALSSRDILIRELARSEFVKDFAATFSSLVDTHLKTNSFNLFENWLHSARLRALLCIPLPTDLAISARRKEYMTRVATPLERLALPSSELADALFPVGKAVQEDPVLGKQLVRAGMKPLDAMKVCQKIERKISQSLGSIRTGSAFVKFSGECIAKEIWCSEPSFEEASFSAFAWALANKRIRLTAGSISLDISIPHLAKLFWLYHETQEDFAREGGARVQPQQGVFHDTNFAINRAVLAMPESSSLRQLLSLQIRAGRGKGEANINMDDIFLGADPSNLVALRARSAAFSTLMKEPPITVVLPRAFSQYVVAAVLRYRSVQGGSNKGGGHQAALSHEVFTVLEKDFGVAMEGFASPFNARFSRYCSAFPDTDAAFGSIGSFFSFYPTEGSIEVNPPFDSDVIQLCALHIEQLLQNPDAGALSFVIIVPKNDDVVGWKTLVTSPYKRAHLLVPERKHAFYVGIQQSKKIRHIYHTARHDTSVFVLQNDKGAEKYPVTMDKLANLQSAFQVPFTPKSGQVSKKSVKQQRENVVEGVVERKDPEQVEVEESEEGAFDGEDEDLEEDNDMSDSLMFDDEDNEDGEDME